jgi:phenylpropionate dioxygenase-like ring-hydroxylating dioxygenase large terminal subunit
MADFLTVAEGDELSPGQARQVEVHGKRLALFNIDGNFYGLEGSCTHRGEPLSVGTIAGDLRVARCEVQHPNRKGARLSRASRHRPLQRLADGNRYRDSGLKQSPLSATKRKDDP